MQTTTNINIGLVGFGVVGKGLYDVLQRTPALQATVKKICIKHLNKKRILDNSIFTHHFYDLLKDDTINVIVELIDDAEVAYQIVKASLQKGKAVVSANKKMIAAHFKELMELQKTHNVAFLYEASCCAGIPVIRNLEEYYDNDLLSQIRGIINGSTNFILTKITEEGLSFKEALQLAQAAGFAESDPTLDIEGHDAANKLTILAPHAFGTIINTQNILYTGITSIKKQDALYANEKGCTIKLVAHAKKISHTELAVLILPQLVKKEDDLYNVKNEFNALETESFFADKHFFKGKGAGAYPTAAAVLSDISALRYGYKYEYKKMKITTQLNVGNNYFVQVIVSADDVTKIKESSFLKIEEWHSENNYVRIRGTISALHLKENEWWKKEGVSLLLNVKAFDVAASKKIKQGEFNNNLLNVTNTN